jgi:transposase
VKKNQQQKQNTPKERHIQVVMPLDLGVKIGTEDSVRLLLEIMEGMDYRELNAAYDRQTRAEEATPKQMFQLVIFGFMNRAHSTREMEAACRNDIRFMYLLRGKRVPDHSRFGSFIRDRLQGSVAEGLFYQLVKQLEARGEINFKDLFVDGTKIEADANRYSFVWAKAVGKNEARLDEKLKALITRLMKEYAIILPENATPESYLTELKARGDGVEFVHGRGKRKTQLQRDIEVLETYLAQKEKYKDYTETFRGRNSFSKTDRDATFMRMKEDHMKNGQLKPGYNLQLGVEGEYIVGADLSSERSDERTLLHLLNRMYKGLGRRHEAVTADAGYESEENYKELEQYGQAAYIKPQNYEKSKTPGYRNNAYLREHMPYDPEADTYTCPAGKLFTPQGETKRRSKSGFEATVTIYECSGCENCAQKKLCTRAKGNRQMEISKDFIALRQASFERITSEHGRVLRLNRSIQSEGTFGVLKQDYGFRRYLRRGETNVFTETLLYAIAFDINKLHAKITNKRNGCVMHMLNSA